MPDYREIDWDQERPTDAEVKFAWRQTRVTPLDLEPGVQRVVEALNQTHDNGGALAAQFLLEVDPATRWFLCRNRLPESFFFRAFFNHELVAPRLTGDDLLPPGEHHLGFELEDPFVVMGRLAATLSQGGAYNRFPGPDADIVRLMDGFAHAAFGGRYSETFSYISRTPWSPWFENVAWDGSWFWLDRQTGVATVLLVTDTD